MITGKRSEFEQRLTERGYTLAEVAGCIVAEDGDTITVDETHADYPRHRKPDAAPLAVIGGPGTELKALLSRWIGIEADSGCQCNSMAARMDALGPAWCESDAGLPEILEVMQAEHAKRWAEGRTRLPWSDFAATQLVRLACRRARAKAPPAD